MKRIVFRSRLIGCMAGWISLMACSSPEETVFPVWQAGEMEIHHIYTGRGESNFLIFPDGTSLLVDVGDWDPSDYPKMCEPLPDASRRAGTWVARYVNRVNPHRNEVDYLMVSHFHNDHTGDSTMPLPQTDGQDPDYKLVGITEAGQSLRFGHVFDRGYPDYQYPLPIQDPDVENYRAFLKNQQRIYGLQQEAFVVGQENQICLLHDRERYQSLFSIRNLAANGEVWTGTEGETRRLYDLNEANLDPQQQNENTKSLALRISYGPFRYYCGGDVSGRLLDGQGEPVNVEELVAKACGPVDVCKANHHAYKDAMTEGFVRSVQARQFIIPVWDYEHIQPDVIQRIVSLTPAADDPIIFPTCLPQTLQRQYADEPWMKTVAPVSGHVVVKVFDKGKRYQIYVLSSLDEEMHVRAVYGPYVVN
ncbi:MAG: ComEC/Rec2 family competence protein [Parabacteroides sp.]